MSNNGTGLAGGIDDDRETSSLGQQQTQMQRIPVFLLKTKAAAAADGYEEYFRGVSHAEKDQQTRENTDGREYEPIFVPVLEHQFDEKGLESLRELLGRRDVSARADSRYGGMIFTSQRAVEGFAKVVQEGEREGEKSDAQESATSWPHLQDIPIYTVGPATTRALRGIPQTPPLSLFGEETGNGEALAHYMLDHYNDWLASLPPSPPPSTSQKPALLFLVGEQRRDIIPKTLMDTTTLSPERRIQVDEITLYGTGVKSSFAEDFSSVLSSTADSPTRWVVVFSPTGCKAMLEALDMLDPQTGRVRTGERGGGCGVRRGKRQTYIATIGPTTRDYLRKTFGFEPDVCAEKPSPEGVGEGIRRFMEGIESQK